MLPGVTQYMAGNHRVGVATLFRFEGRTRTLQLWDGHRTLKTLDGQKWIASGKLISASGLEQSRGMTAPQATFTLEGATDDMVNWAANAETEITNRPCSVFAQFLTSRYEPLDMPISVWSGVMDTMNVNAGVKNQVISLSAEQLFVARIRALYGFMTDQDQQARWPGDLGLEFMPQLRNKKTKWMR